MFNDIPHGEASQVPGIEPVCPGFRKVRNECRYAIGSLYIFHGIGSQVRTDRVPAASLCFRDKGSVGAAYVEHALPCMSC